jgi:hypothetical protein
LNVNHLPASFHTHANDLHSQTVNMDLSPDIGVQFG